MRLPSLFLLFLELADALAVVVPMVFEVRVVTGTR